MSEHRVTVQWKKQTPDFTYDSYDRTHAITFPGGQSLQGSAAVEYKGKAQYANPEELFVASLSTCHMLTFLAIAAKMGWIVETYADDAVGVLGKGPSGKLQITHVTLTPQVRLSGPKVPPKNELSAALKSAHQKAHANCFIANSVAIPVEVTPA